MGFSACEKGGYLGEPYDVTTERVHAVVGQVEEEIPFA